MIIKNTKRCYSKNIFILASISKPLMWKYIIPLFVHSFVICYMLRYSINNFIPIFEM